MEYADKIIKGKIYTANEQQKYAEAFAIKDGRILAIGSKEEIKQYLGADTDVKDIQMVCKNLCTTGFAYFAKKLVRKMKEILL